MKKKLLHAFLIILCGIVVGLSFGLSYGNINHNTYLIEGLRMVDSHVLEYDWFATQTTHYHHSFKYLVYILHCFGNPAWNFAIGNVITIAIGIIFIWRWLFAMSPKYAISTFMLLTSLIMLLETRTVAASYIFSVNLQPSTLAATAFLGALAFFISGQFLISGIFLGVSGWFHNNFLLLGFPFFLGAHLLLYERKKNKQMFFHLTSQFGLSLIVLASIMPTMIKMSLSEHAETARYIFQEVGATGHYIPRTFLKNFIPFYGWHILALACIGLPLMTPIIRRRLYALYATFVGLVTLATLLTTVVFIPIISQLFFWRMAPFAELIAQILILPTIIQYLDGTLSASFSFHSWRVYLVSLGLAMVLWKFYPGGWLNTLIGTFASRLSCVVILGGILPIGVIFFFRWYAQTSFCISNYQKLQTVTIVVFIMTMFLAARPAYLQSTLLIEFPKKEEQELYNWAKTTLSHMKFLTPFDVELKNFRLQTRRAVIVDWDTRPILPDEVLEWYRRVTLICGDKNVRNRAHAIQKYIEMDQPRLLRILEKFDVNYVVFYKDRFQSEDWHDFPIVFSNSKFVVLQTQPST